MTSVRAFDGYVVNPESAREIVAPAYDSMSPAERARYAESNPRNYLNVMRTREDYPPGADITTQEILVRNKENLHTLIDSDGFLAVKSPCLYIYRLSQDGHTQTGLVAELPVAEIEAGHVLKHEQTRQDREELLVEYQEQVGATSSPVALAYRAVEPIRDCINRFIESNAPLLDLDSEDGVSQQLWSVDDADTINTLCGQFENVPYTYLTDGHHRTASAARYVAKLRETGNMPDDDGAWNHVLVALFPDDELQVLPFHRCVYDVPMGDQALLEALSARYTVDPLNCDAARPPQPERPGVFTLVLGESCYRLALKKEEAAAEGGDKLDVTLLEESILIPLLGITDSRLDPRLEYVSGSSGFDGVNHLRDRGWHVTFYCHPPSIADIMRVSDAGDIMPPKSTCFEPKVRSGLFLRINDH